MVLGPHEREQRVALDDLLEAPPYLRRGPVVIAPISELVRAVEQRRGVVPGVLVAEDAEELRVFSESRPAVLPSERHPRVRQAVPHIRFDAEERRGHARLHGLESTLIHIIGLDRPSQGVERHR